MSDDLMKNLEAELRRVRPAAMPESLRDRLKDEPGEEPLTMGDWVLATFSGMGTIAACIVVAMTTWQIVASSPQSPGSVPLAARQQRVSEYQQLLAAR